MDLGIWEDLRDRLSLANLGKPALIGLAALVIMVAVFAGKNIVDAATASEFKIERDDVAECSQSSDASPQTIFVHISGAVKAPGLVELEAGSRVADAVKAAGGFADDAIVDSVNLARPLQDGEQVFVSAQGGSPDSFDASGTGGGPAAQGAGDAQLGPAGSRSGGKVNINSASQAELETLPGIGPSIAQRIVSDRTANGSFSSVEDLTRVSGIGDKKLASIADLICV